jgi:hypothetical protein
MRKHLKFLLLVPFLFAVICESDDYVCGVQEPEPFILNVENINETYAPNEIIWINAQTTSMLIDGCTETTDPEIIMDSKVFLDGIFILKLGSFSGLNSKVFEDATIIYELGSSSNSDSCRSIQILPELTQDNLFYNYRIGISVPSIGDYCIVSARSNYFNLQSENNAQIFTTYDSLNNDIKFQSCGNTFTRSGALGNYFFRVN